MWDQGVQKTRNPFIGINDEIAAIEGYIEEDQTKVLLYKFLYANTAFTTKLLMGVDLFPFQHVAVKGMLETDYFLGCWSRGGSKSFSTGIFAALHAIFDQGVHIGIISSSFRQCSEKGTLVCSNKGLIPIEEVNVGDYVYSKTRRNKVLNKWSNDPDEGMELTTKRGYTISGKNNHGVMCLDESGMSTIFKDVEDIKEGDYVAVQLGSDMFPTECGSSMSVDDSYFYGLVVGDGFFRRGTGSDYVNITSADESTRDFLREYSRSKNLNLSELRSKESNCWNLRLCSNDFVLKFFEGWEKNSATKKDIPKSILRTTKENASNFLSGYFDADGTVGMDRVEVATSSKKLAKQTQIMLANFGILSKIQKEEARGSIVICGVSTVGRESYKVRITGSKYIKRFSEEIGFRLPEKVKKLKKLVNSLDGVRMNMDAIPSSGLYLSSRYKFPETLSKNMGKDRINKTLDKYSDRISKEDASRLRELSESDISWERVDKIKNIGNVETIDIEVEGEHCYVSNSIISSNSKMIFKKIEDLAKGKGADLLRQCITKVSKQADEWTMEIGDSKISALPLGDGEKLRGFRFQCIIIDEFLLMPEKVFNEVITPMLAVVLNPTERQEMKDAEDELIKIGEMTEDERHVWKSNKLITLSSASYKFEYMYDVYCKYEQLITGGLDQRKDDAVGALTGNDNIDNNPDKAHRVISHISYDALPKALYDENLIKQSVATMSQSQFDREFGAVFTEDSSGYFKVLKMAACTFEDGVGDHTEIIGDPKSKYIVSFDPSWSEDESSDDWSLQVLKIDRDNPEKHTVVHSYALSGTPVASHIKYLKYVLDNFNVEMVFGDYMGGVQFIQACNESTIFKDANQKLEVVDSNKLDNKATYVQGLRHLRNQVNKDSQKFVFLRKPGTGWIREANELLQANIDHKRIRFAGRSVGKAYQKQQNANIPSTELKFRNSSKEEESLDSGYGSASESRIAKNLDFIEHQSDMINLTKSECALIVVTSTATGTQKFDLPPNLRNQSGANKARKDSYSSLLIGNWGCKIYHDMMQSGIEYNEGFTPTFLT